jgi:WD40 repeat protein
MVIAGESGRAWILDDGGNNPWPLRRENALAHIGSILSIVFSNDSSHVLLTRGIDGKITVWNVLGASLETVLSGHRCRRIDFS